MKNIDEEEKTIIIKAIPTQFNEGDVFSTPNVDDGEDGRDPDKV